MKPKRKEVENYLDGLVVEVYLFRKPEELEKFRDAIDKFDDLGHNVCEYQGIYAELEQDLK